VCLAIDDELERSPVVRDGERRYRIGLDVGRRIGLDRPRRGRLIAGEFLDQPPADGFLYPPYRDLDQPPAGGFLYPPCRAAGGGETTLYPEVSPAPI